MDLNVEKAWLQGYTGKGILVAVVDDGQQVNESKTCINSQYYDIIICNHDLFYCFSLGLQWSHADINSNYVRKYFNCYGY